MSAPPIGITSITPKASASTISSGNRNVHVGLTTRTPMPIASAQQREVDEVLARVGDRPRRQHFLQLAGGHQAAGAGQEAEQDLEDDRAGAEGRQVAGAGPE